MAISEETRKKLRDVHLGKKQSEETRKRIGDANRGKKRSEESRKRISEVRLGKKHSEETRKRIGELHLGNKYCLGKKASEETRKKLSEGKLGNKYCLGRRASEETRKKLSEYRVTHPNKKFMNTSIELAMKAELESRGIYFEQQKGLCKVANVDFYLPDYKVVIQCDGDYWHTRESQILRDKRQDKVLRDNGYRVFRFWEHEIKNGVSTCVDTILESIFNYMER